MVFRIQTIYLLYCAVLFILFKKLDFFIKRHRVQTKKIPVKTGIFFNLMARRTGLEPATPGVTGRYSNQLSYHRASIVRDNEKESGG